jgi:glycosyltransferase involved in cell wall biosynthesis
MTDQRHHPSVIAVEPIRVLLVSHTCQSRDEGQPKAVELGRFDDIDLRVLVPDRWKHYGVWRAAAEPLAGRYAYSPSPVRFPSLGPAQSYLHHYPAIRKLLKEFRPHVIDLWEEPWSWVSAHTIRARNQILPSAYVISETEQNIDKHLPPPFEQFRRYTLRHADFLVGRNTESIEIVRRKGYRGPSEVVPNAVDVTRFQPMDRTACKARYGVSGFVIGYAGRLVEEKGLAEIMDAMQSLPADVQLLVAGDGPLRPTLEAFARQPSFVGRVHILGAVAADQLGSVMNAMDVLLIPSRTTARWKEQFGRVIIEAHACGVPVIGSTSGAIPDVIGQAGLVVPERDAAQLAQAIATMRADPAKTQAMGEIGRRRAHEEFTWAAVARRMRAIYGTLMKSQARAHEH